MYSQSTGEVNSNIEYVLATSKMNQTSDPCIRSWKSLTTLEVMTYYLVMHTGPGPYIDSDFTLNEIT